MTSKVADEIIQNEHDSALGAKRVTIAGPLESNGAIPVNIQDQASDIIDLHLTEEIDTFTVSVNTSLDDKDVNINCDTLPVTGNVVCMKESVSFYQGEILNVVSNGGTSYTITLDSPLDFAYTTESTCSIESQELSIDGSSTPRVFRVCPCGLKDPLNVLDGQRWDVVRLMISINDTTSMDDGKFGGITGGLTNGIVIRKKNSTYKNIFNAKTNGDFRLHAFDAQYISDSLGPSGQFGFGVRRTFGGQSKNGAVIRLDADDNDEFQIIIQDDLTDLTKFHAAVQGHIVED